MGRKSLKKKHSSIYGAPRPQRDRPMSTYQWPFKSVGTAMRNLQQCTKVPTGQDFQHNLVLTIFLNGCFQCFLVLGGRFYVFWSMLLPCYQHQNIYFPISIPIFCLCRRLNGKLQNIGTAQSQDLGKIPYVTKDVIGLGFWEEEFILDYLGEP